MPKRFLTANWHHVCLFTYACPPHLLLPHCPPGTALELHDGNAHVSLVAFDFLQTRVFGIGWPKHATDRAPPPRTRPALAVLSLLPVGLAQTWASVEHGMWYARSAEFLQHPTLETLRWFRAIGDTIRHRHLGYWLVRRRPEGQGARSNRARVSHDQRRYAALSRSRDLWAGWFSTETRITRQSSPFD